MDNKNEKLRINLFEYSQNISSQLSTLCDPFLSAMGLTTFLYGRVFYDGRYIMLSNNTEWVKSWLWNIPTIEKSVLQATLQHVPLEEPYYFLWCTALKSELVQAHNKIGIWHGFDISYRLKDSVEGWSFSTSQERAQINHISPVHYLLENKS